MVDELLARKLMAEDLMSRQSNMPSAAISFTEIMDEELARSLVQSDLTQGSDNLATKLNRQKLYDRYPGSDRNYIDEVFKMFG